MDQDAEQKSAAYPREEKTSLLSQEETFTEGLLLARL